MPRVLAEVLAANPDAVDVCCSKARHSAYIYARFYGELDRASVAIRISDHDRHPDAPWPEDPPETCDAIDLRLTDLHRLAEVRGRLRAAAYRVSQHR